MLRCKSCEPSVKNPQSNLDKHAHLKISLINMLSSVTWWEKNNWICSQYSQSQPVSDENKIHDTYVILSRAMPFIQLQTSFSLRSSYLSFALDRCSRVSWVIWQSQNQCAISGRNLRCNEQHDKKHGFFISSFYYLIEGRALE